MIYFIPSNFDVEQHIEQYPPTGIKHFTKEKLLYTLDLILSIPAGNKDLKVVSGFVPLNSKILSHIVGYGYAALLNYLIDTGVFEMLGGGHYHKGKSRQFRLTQKYRQGFSMVKACDKFASRRKKAKIKRIRKELEKPENRYLDFLYEWYGDGKLKLDLEATKSYLYNTMLKGRVKVRDNSLRDLRLRVNEVNKANHLRKAAPDAEGERGEVQKLTRRERVMQKYFSILLAATRIAEQDYFFKIDDKAGRVHTSLSNLKKELRNFLTYDGKRLVEIDVKNCQPFFSTAILNRRFWEKDTSSIGEKMHTRNFHALYDTHNIIMNDNNVNGTITFAQQHKEGQYTNNIYQRLHNTPVPVMFRKLLEDIDIDEVNRYKELVISGNIYEYLLEVYAARTGRKDMKRENMKKVVFTMLFSKNEEDVPKVDSVKERNIREGRVLAKEIFRSSFPTIYKAFEKIKEGNNALLACLLQSIEAYVILNKICVRVKRERPGLPLFTIHDSLLTTEGNELYLKRVMEEEFYRHIGAVPNLTVKLLCPENLEPRIAQAA